MAEKTLTKRFFKMGKIMDHISEISMMIFTSKARRLMNVKYDSAQHKLCDRLLSSGFLEKKSNPEKLDSEWCKTR